MRDDEKKVLLQQQIEQEIDFDKLTEFCEHLTDAVQEIFRSCGLYFRIFSRVEIDRFYCQQTDQTSIRDRTKSQKTTGFDRHTRRFVLL